LVLPWISIYETDVGNTRACDLRIRHSVMEKTLYLLLIHRGLTKRYTMGIRALL
jgi:hypothetical protein